MKSASKIFILDSSFCTDLPLDLIISQLIFAFAKRCLNAVPTASLDCLKQNKTNFHLKMSFPKLIPLAFYYFYISNFVRYR